MASQGSQENESNMSFLRYCESIFVVTKKEVVRQFFWHYQGGSQYVGDYLADLPRDIKRSLRLGSMEKKALARKDSPVDFDIPTLYTLCQFTCGLADPKDDIWHRPTNDQEEQSLEHSLYLLKEKRNKLCHEPQTLMLMTTEDLDILIDELSRLCENILHKGGEKAGIPTSEVDEFVSRMRKAFDDIKTKPIPSGMTVKQFGLRARIGMKQNHTPSPIGRNFIFPLLQNKGKDGSFRRELQDFPLWQCGSGSNPKTIVVSGETGIGKTTICGHIYDSWMSNSTDISHLGEFDLVVPVQCCSVSTCDVPDFLRGFMEDTHSLCSRKEISTNLKSLNILWLFDGFDEATNNAIELLKQIPQYQGTSSLVFITTQPQRLQDLINKKLITTETTVVAQLLGFSEDAVEHFLRNELNGKEKDFLQDVRDLSEDLLQELRVPLKLKLMVKLWKDGKLRKKSGASVYFLYKSIMEAHAEKFKKKLQEKGIDDENIELRDRSWETHLCKIAFDMIVNNQLVKINRKYQERLEEAAQWLIYPKDCLSTYLQSESNSKNNSYSFIHVTQQIYLAAQYISCMIKEEGTFPQELLQIFDTESSTQKNQSDYILYLMLLQVVSSVAQQNNVKSNIIKDLVQLCSTFRYDFNAFEVIRHAEYDSLFTEEVSKCCEETWMIYDHDVRAAVAVMQHVTPASITICTEKDPNDAQELPLLLQHISERNIELELLLSPHVSVADSSDTSDKFLSDICSTDTKCHMRRFHGCLSKSSLKNLYKMKDITVLDLKVTSNEDLNQILIILESLKKLEHLSLTFMMPVLSVPSSPSFSVGITNLTIDLPFMHDSKVNETADAISSISKHFETIYLHDVSASSAVQFIQRLQERNVTVKEIIRKVSYKDFDMSGFFEIEYGCVPLTQPIKEFYYQWQNTSLETYMDDLGKRRFRLTGRRIPNQSVAYYDVKSLTHSRVTKFS